MKHYCVISHTHWDREWYQTQEEFRMRLVDLIDHLLEILDNNAEYVFHMDAQTIVFEDYFEIRPETRSKICDYIKKGRILVGPWYVQNDFFLTSGEATVRNLLLGIKQAEELGGCAQTGYTPDQFGLISQLPQIFCGFDIDHCVFGRGYTLLEVDENSVPTALKYPSEINWQSPDGSGVLGLFMPKFYNNAQRFSENIDKAMLLLDKIKNDLNGYATTDYLLLMNGVDHLEPQENLLPILEKMNERLGVDEKIYQTSMQNYAALVKEALPEEKRPTEIGELVRGGDMNLLKDTASSRIYIKQQNARLQDMLSHQIEPLYALLSASGLTSTYPSGHIDYLWKMLIRNHAHDSICGCSRDAVHAHIEDRFKQISEMGNELLRRGLNSLCAHARVGFSYDDYQIAVFNPLSKKRSEVVEVTLDILAKDEPKTLKITSPDGTEISYEIISREELEKSVFSPVNLPGRFNTIRYVLRFFAEDIAPLGYSIYKVEVNKEPKENKFIPICLDNALENEYIKAEVMANGKISITNKQNDKTYNDVLEVVDTADTGDSYVYRPILNDTPICLSQFTPKITTHKVSALSGSIVLSYNLVLPCKLDRENMRRSAETVSMPFEIWLILKKGAKQLEVTFKFENKAEDHRLCAHVKTGLETDVAVASTPFDMVVRNKFDIDTRICNQTEHHNGAVCLCDGENAFSVLSRGLYAYEHLQNENGTFTFPLVRSNGVISAGLLSGDGTWRAEENQCKRPFVCEFALMPTEADAYITRSAEAFKEFQNPLFTQGEAVDVKKFTGGRPGVQDSAIHELFYLPVPHADVSLPSKSQGISLSDGAVVTAFKKSFDRSGLILRFVNAADFENEVTANFGSLNIKAVYKTNLKETARELLSVCDGKITLKTKAKEIVTLFIEQ